MLWLAITWRSSMTWTCSSHEIRVTLPPFPFRFLSEFGALFVALDLGQVFPIVLVTGKGSCDTAAERGW